MIPVVSAVVSGLLTNFEYVISTESRCVRYIFELYINRAVDLYDV